MHVSLISDESINELTQGTEYTITDRVVTLSAPTTLKIKIYRQTTTTPLVGWADASVLRAADMNVQSTQLLHLAEETADLAQDGGLSKDTTDNVWDARFNKIKNILEPTDPGDAVTLSYIMKNQTGLLTQLNATGDNQNTRLINTGAAQNTSIVSTGDTQNGRLTTTGNNYVATMTTLKDTATTQASNASSSASSASTSASTATTQASNASSSATSASSSASTATTKATDASNSAELAKKWAMSDSSPDGVSGNKSSKTWATASANSASEAFTYASNASTSAANARTSETNAANSATAASQSADRAATFDPSSYYSKTETYTKTEVDTIKDNIISTPLVGNAVLWDYLHRLGENPTLPTTNSALNALGVFMSYFKQNKIANQPVAYGQLLNLPADKGDESAQLWIEQCSGRMFHRGGNASIAVNDVPFKRFLDTDDVNISGSHMYFNDGKELWIE